MNTKAKQQRILEKSRIENLESTSIQIISREAKETLAKENFDLIEVMEIQLKTTEIDSQRHSMTKELSSLWFDLGHPSMAGYYAELLAKETQTEDAWSITGTTYLYGVKNATEQKLKDFCFKRAINALENAISINPGNIDHRINLALGFVDYPPSDNPMKGILQLIDLNKKNPDDVKVLNQLARLGLETNQVEKAIKRLEHALSISPENKNSICLIANAYRRNNNINLADQFDKQCAEVINKK